jgi:DNA-binding protein HU-beta
MHKQELVKLIANGAGLSKAKSEEVMDLMIEQIIDVLCMGESVCLGDLGKFVLVEKKSRLGRNFNTGEKIKIAGKWAVKFQAGKQLREDLLDCLGEVD